MKFEDLLSCSQKLTIGHNRQPSQLFPHHNILVIQDSFSYYPAYV